MKILRKKSQTTLFIIMGLIVLISGALFFYFSGVQKEKEIAPGVYITVEEIPTEFNPIKDYVTACLEKTSLNALSQISNGGYINDFEVSKTIFSFSQNPTESEAVQFSPGSELRIPYWYYMKSDNKCTDCGFSSKIPIIKGREDSMEDQISRYVIKNLDSCLDFGAFEGYKVSTGDINVKATIAEDEVVVVANYHIDAEINNISSRISQFYVSLPVNLKRIHSLAEKLTKLEAENSYLEKDLLNLIVGFSSVDENKLPPMAETKLEFGSKTVWSKTKVNENIKEILQAYIPFIQVYNTENYNPIETESVLKDSLYNRGMLVPLDENYKDLAVNFVYLDFWPIYFDLNCKGDICKPESAASTLILPIGINRYNFLYDVSFPVMVEITDKKALNNRGYTFRFFLEGNVRNNEPLATTVLLEGIAVSEESMLCDENKRNSGEINIEVSDKKDIPLDDVQVLFDCAGENCVIGETKYGLLKERFPVCVGGLLSYVKEGYLTGFATIDTELDKQDNLEVRLEPFRDKKIKLMKKKIIKTQDGWAFLNFPNELDEKEEALVSMKRIGSAKEGNFETAFEYKNSQDTEVEILPGKYEVDIITLLYDKIKIPEREEEVGTFFKKEKIKYPEINFDETKPFPSGGLNMELNINANNLDSHGTIVLYVVSIDLGSVPESERRIDDLEQINRIEEYSNAYAVFLKPGYE